MWEMSAQVIEGIGVVLSLRQLRVPPVSPICHLKQMTECALFILGIFQFEVWHQS